ncbi:uncharacterized protein Triagg1_2745 [Trichoderma aggressivum f. europaeum]|uniref:Uncharacterized protein n=1 Tax=Trichoderma aggressivum f. europaeum TaxID=173218 RepID=A0AAE1IGJ9_9HYPO|nr:hypothetical protein Triagg1_2745 [Trichoderma aggressivum f. europaeum]
MDRDGNGPFRLGAANPLLGDETYGEEGQGFPEAIADAFTNQSTGHDAYGAQEWGDGGTLNPSMLQGSDLTPPGVALGIPTGPSGDAYVDSVPSGIEGSHDET